MAQHFLLSAESRTLSLKSIYQAGEAKGYETFKRMRCTPRINHSKANSDGGKGCNNPAFAT